MNNATNSGGLKIVLWNVRSLNNKTEEVMEHILDYSADITFFTETWLTSQKNDVTAKFSTYGYNLYHSIRKDEVKLRGGGTGILSRIENRLSKVKTSKFESFEHCAFSLRKDKHDKIVLVAFYRRKEVSISLFMTEFAELLETLSSMNSILLLAGDANIHMDEKYSVDTISFTNLLDSFNLIQLVQNVTHKEGHLLDVLICNDANICHDILVSNVNLSDHFMVTCIVDFVPKPTSHYKTITYRKLKTINHAKLVSDLNRKVEICSQSTFEESVLHYNNVLVSTVNFHAPLLSKTIKIVPYAPWFDSEYAELRKKRRKAEKLYRQTKLMVHWTNFTNLRKQTTALALQKKKVFTRSKINSAINSQKALSSTLKKLTGHDNAPVYPNLESDAVIANGFAEFFDNKVKTIRNNLELKDDSDFMCSNITVNVGIQFLSEFVLSTPEEIREIINEHGLKCCFSDPCPAEVYKANLDFFVPLWTQLVNKSLLNGSMECLKHADIIPLLKSDDLDPNCFKNFRPVSNLQFLGKLIERVVLKRLNDHLTRNNLNVPNQHGYKKGHSTESILIKITNDILIACDKKTATVLLLLDLSSAFDTVDVNVLLDILCKEMGIKGNALKWFRSFLTNRTMRVKINESFSDIYRLEFGIPQGSVLGPVLFSIYVRSIYKLVEQHGFDIKGFADDHQLYVSFTPGFQHHYLGLKINRIINILNDWMGSFFLKLNTEKTQIIVFGPKTIRDSIGVHGMFIDYDNSCLRFRNVVNNLGVLFDSDMSFTSQVRRSVNAAFLTIKSISRISSFLSKNEKTILTCSLVLSKLDYCNSLYYGIHSALLNRLQYVQNCAARLVFKLKKYDHVSDILNDLHWLPIRNRIIYKLLLTVHKCLYNVSSEELNDLLLVESSRTFNLRIEKCNTSFGTRAFSICASKH